MKKKHPVLSKDQEDWLAFTKHMGEVIPKKEDFLIEKKNKNVVPRLDLHGFSLSESNKIVKKFIIKSFNDGYKKLLVITGKGIRSKSYNNPYISDKLNILRYSVPEFIKNEENLKGKINKISEAEIQDGGEGAIYIYLKNNKKFIE